MTDALEQLDIISKKKVLARTFSVDRCRIFGCTSSLTEIAVHAQDIRRALGIPHKVSDEVANVIRTGAEAQKKATPDVVAALMDRLDSATAS